MISFSSSELASAATLKAGDSVLCKTCSAAHVLSASVPPALLFYRCGENSYLAAVDGKSVMK